MLEEPSNVELTRLETTAERAELAGTTATVAARDLLALIHWLRHYRREAADAESLRSDVEELQFELNEARFKLDELEYAEDDE